MSSPAQKRWQVLSPLLDELLDLDAPGRDARLQALADQDADLADELRALLASVLVCAATLAAAADTKNLAPNFTGLPKAAKLVVMPLHCARVCAGSSHACHIAW